MHFNFRHLAEYGYDILGLKTYSISSCYTYVKYFPETFSVVVCSVSRNNSVQVFFLSDKDYYTFRNGKGVLSEHKSDTGKRALGGGIYVPSVCKTIFSGGELNRKAKLKSYLDEAEDLASKYTLIRSKLISIK